MRRYSFVFCSSFCILRSSSFPTMLTTTDRFPLYLPSEIRHYFFGEEFHTLLDFAGFNSG